MPRLVYSGTFTGTGQSPTFGAQPDYPLNITLSGTFSATVQLERSFDNGSTWFSLTVDSSPWAVYSTPVSEQAWVPTEAGILYRLNCTSYSSGTVTYRVSQ